MKASEVRRSVCALDCPDACSMLVHIEAGRATKVEGDPDHPVTRGFLCGKVAQYLEREYHPERLLFPQRRVGKKGEGKFVRITWDEALDTIAARLRETIAQHGSESILPYSYGGNMGFLNGGSMDRRFFHRLGASRLDRTICATAGATALMEALGAKTGTEPEQFAEAKLIIVWGANVHGTSIHLWPFIVEARRRGAKLITIDPVLTKTAALADQHLFINPGTDLALALGLMHVIFAEGLEDRDYLARHTTGLEELKTLVRDYPPARAAALTGIPADTIVQLARDYATTRPAVIRANYGLQRSERGGRAMQAIACLPAITGSWKDVGGGFCLSTSGGFTVDRAALERADLQQLALGREARLINMSTLGEALAQDGVHAMVVYNSNPAAVAPNTNRVRAGLLREDLFTVVLEQFATDTTDYADIVLPVTTFLENTDLYFAYGHYHLQMTRPALDAPGECKTNVEIFRLLAARMGLTDACFADTEDDMMRQALASGHRYLEGITLEQLDRERSVRLNVAPAGEPFQPHAQGGFLTPSGKCDFKAETLAYTPPVESRQGDAALRQRFPLELISSKNNDSMNSTFGYREHVDAQTARAILHPEDAAARGIGAGDTVRVFNERGSLRLHVEIAPKVLRGVVRVPAVRWGKKAGDQQTVNVLTSERLTDIGAGATFYSCLVEVEKCGD
ncbi:MAG: molybdopterin-dependent oxidoreductase [Bryobacteraceae bacterium]|nr:molybdopterin-dependent oxidoreductase [Bryobacteraceae bacterium]